MSIKQAEGTGLWVSPGGTVFVSHELIDAIRSFPVKREIEHCGITFQVSSLDFYAVCPNCGTQIKMRSFSANHELPEVFDTVLEWLQQPDAEKIFEKRKAEIRDDMED